MNNKMVSVCVKIGSKFGNEGSLKIALDTILTNGSKLWCDLGQTQRNFLEVYMSSIEALIHSSFFLM